MKSLPSKTLSNIESILILISFGSIAIIDSINGFIIRNFDTIVSLGQIYRILLIIFMLYLITKFRQFRIIPILIVGYLTLIQILYFLIYHGSVHILFNDLVEISKFILIIFIIEAFKALRIHEKNFKRLLRNIFLANLILFPVSLLIPKLLGVGYSMYSNNVGNSGFFYAANDLNAVLIILFAYGINILFQGNLTRNKWISFSVIVLSIAASLILLGSKSSIAFTALIIFIYTIKFFKEKKKYFSRKNIVLSLTGIVVLMAAAGIVFNDDINKSLERHSYFFEKQAKEGNVISFIVTGRDEFLSASYQAYVNADLKFLRFWLGVGSDTHAKETAAYFSDDRDSLIIEMDIWDTLFRYGFLGVVIMYGYLLLIIYEHVRLNQNYNFNFLLCFALLLMYSSLGGHVLYSALSGSFLALVCAGLLNPSYTFEQKKGPPLF